MNAASNRDFEVEKLAVLREQGAITDEEYQWARIAVLREQGAISDEKYHEARRRFRVEVERLVALRDQGTITDQEYQDRRLRCAMRLEAAANEEERQLRRKARLGALVGKSSALVGFVLVCVATAAATWTLILFNRDPSSNDPLVGWLIAISFFAGGAGLALLIVARRGMGLSPHPLSGTYRALVTAGIVLAVVGIVIFAIPFFYSLGSVAM